MRDIKGDPNLELYLMCYLRMDNESWRLFKTTDVKADSVEVANKAESDRPPRCLLCRKSFSNRAGLHRHVWGFHDFQETFPCPECHALRSQKVLVQPGRNAWSYHVSEAHDYLDTPDPKAARSLCCLICDRKFTQKGVQEHFQKQHIKTRTFDSAFECPPCSKQGRKTVIKSLGLWIEHAKVVHLGEETLFGAVQ